MKACRLVVLAASSWLLLACTHTAEHSSAYVAPESVASADRIVQDAEYIARVEAIARRRGVDVTWVNAPVKREKPQE